MAKKCKPTARAICNAGTADSRGVFMRGDVRAASGMVCMADWMLRHKHFEKSGRAAGGRELYILTSSGRRMVDKACDTAHGGRGKKRR